MKTQKNRVDGSSSITNKKIKNCNRRGLAQGLKVLKKKRHTETGPMGRRTPIAGFIIIIREVGGKSNTLDGLDGTGRTFLQLRKPCCLKAVLLKGHLELKPRKGRENSIVHEKEIGKEAKREKIW